MEQYAIEQHQVQIVFMLQPAKFTASRPGAIIESACAKGSNRALLYHHCQLKLIYNPIPDERRYL